MPRSLVMDEEIVCLDEHGRCQFKELLFRRSQPRFIAFDLLLASGKDLRRERLLDRKHELRKVIGNGPPPIIFVDHVFESGIALFEKACELDLEGIVAKHEHPPYDPARSTWFKIRNTNYSQMLDARNCSSRSDIGSQFLGGTPALWRVLGSNTVVEVA